MFGDQALFDGAPEYAEAVGVGKPLQDALVFYKFSDGEFQYKYEAEIDDWKVSTCNHPQSVIKAMRRIIKEPKQWTLEDKKAGVLPEVGCRVDFCHKLNTNWRTGEIKYIDNHVTLIKADDIDRPFVYEFDRVEFNPIETPAEKAQRLRSEWVKHALDLYMSSPKNDVASMGDVYDALLSGELKAPGVE